MGFFATFWDELQRGVRPAYFPDDLVPGEDGLVALGGDITVETVLEAYAKGMFPWTGEHPIPWCSPDPRLILPPPLFDASRSLRKLQRKGRYTVRFDHNFQGVMGACASTPRPNQPGTWITTNMRQVYGTLYRMNIAHSVEVYEDGELCGGLYGLSLGRAFFGESMFSSQSNTSKLALYTLSQRLVKHGFLFIDCQQETEHLQSLGAYPIPRVDYLELLNEALAYPSHHYSWSVWDETQELLASES